MLICFILLICVIGVHDKNVFINCVRLVREITHDFKADLWFKGSGMLAYKRHQRHTLLLYLKTANCWPSMQKELL